MPNDDYVSSLDGGQIESALEAIDGVADAENNGKVLYVSNGQIRARSASDFIGKVDSVNGKTGVVTLNLDDIPDGETYARATPAQLQQIGADAANVAALKGLVPAEASAQNQLADKAYVADALAPYRTAAAQDEIDDAMGDEVDALKSALSTKSLYPFAPDATIFNKEYDGTNAQKIANAILNVEFYNVPENYKYHIESTYLNGTLSGNPYTQIAIKGVRNDGAVNARAFLYTDDSASHSGIETIIVPPVAGFSGYAVVTVDFTGTGFNAAPTFAQCKLSQQCIKEKKKTRLLVLGDSWSDTDPAHTTYTKWPALLEATGRYEVINYAQNGSSISGDTPNFGLNGNVAGQMQKMATDNVQGVDVVVIFGGINDFRGTVSNPYVYNKIAEFVPTLKARFPGVRIIYISNNQIYITQQQIDYFRGIIDYLRNIVGIEAFDTFGWCYPGYYLNDFVHVNNDGYKVLAANILSILEGGAIRRVIVNYHYTGGGNAPDVDIRESWEDGTPHYSAKMNASSAILGTSNDMDFDASSPSTRFLLASVPFCKQLNKGYVTESGKPTGIISCEAAETYTTTSRLNTTNSIRVIVPSVNAGIYFSDNFN